MVSEIMSLLRGSPLMKRAVSEFGDMLVNDEYLFNQTWQILVEQADIDRIPQNIYDRDNEVNAQERKIRQLLVQHLTLHPKHDTSGCLALMSLVKDAERIGDYSKNIVEVGIMYKGTIKDIKYFPRLAAVKQRISDRFPILINAFRESNTQLAETILKEYGSIKNECDLILQDLFSDELPALEAIAIALLSRHLKRINSHMSNVASGIIYPLDEIDFVREETPE